MYQKKITTGLAAWCISLMASSQTPNNYEIAQWYQFKKAAVTYTFDDNTANQLKVAFPLFDNYNYKVTLYCPTNWIKDWSSLKAVAQNHHEIGSHTVDHSSLSSLDVSKQTEQLANSQAAFNRELAPVKCETIAYPYCNMGDETTIASYYIAGRICSGQIVAATPDNFYQISSIATGSNHSVKTAADFNAQTQSALNANGWCVFLLHGIDDDGGYSPTSSKEIATHLAYMNENKNNYWIGTFAHVVKYIKERDHSTISESFAGKKEIRLNMVNALPNETYNVPISIRRKLPQSWKNANVFDNEQPTPSRIVEIDNVKYIEFEAIPNQSSIVIRKS